MLDKAADTHGVRSGLVFVINQVLFFLGDLGAQFTIADSKLNRMDYCLLWLANSAECSFCLP